MTFPLRRSNRTLGAKCPRARGTCSMPARHPGSQCAVREANAEELSDKGRHPLNSLHALLRALPTAPSNAIECPLSGICPVKSAMPTSAFEPSAAVADRAAGAPRGAPLGHAAPGWVLTVTALGVVYGDIGTSPLYAIQAGLKASGRDAPGPLEVLGIVSLVFWALMLVVSLKYVAIVLCADNEGEGGILALLSLVSPPATLPAQGGTGRLPF